MRSLELAAERFKGKEGVSFKNTALRIVKLDENDGLLIDLPLVTNA